MSQIHNLAEAEAWFENYPGHSVEGEAWGHVRAELRRLRAVEGDGVGALRARARDLYRRSDNVPLSRGGSGIDRLADLRNEADALMARADRLEASTR